MSESKSVQQIVTEWRAIEAKRPGGQLNAVLQPVMEARHRCSEQEQRLIKVIETLHNTVQGYHVEMGTLIEHLAGPVATLAPAPRVLEPEQGGEG